MASEVPSRYPFSEMEYHVDVSQVDLLKEIGKGVLTMSSVMVGAEVWHAAVGDPGTILRQAAIAGFVGVGAFVYAQARLYEWATHLRG